MKMVRDKESPPMIPFVGTIQKRLFRDTGRFGLFSFGYYEFGSENEINRDFCGVYQMRNCSEGRVPCKMRFQISRESKPTPARVARWTKFSEGVLAWQALTDEQKAVYNKKAIGKHRTGFNVYMTKHMLS